MATNASPFIVNIVDLQNIPQSITGDSQSSLLASAQASIANIQQMINVSTHTISVNTIQSYTTGSKIQVLSDLNLNNTSIYSSGSVLNSGTSAVTISTISTVSYISSISYISSLSYISTFSTVYLNQPISTIGGSNTYISVNDSASTISFIHAGTPSLQLTSTGMLEYISSSTHLSTGVTIHGYLYVSESGFAKQFVSLSDKTLKTNIKPFFTTINDVLKLEPRTFNWTTTHEPDLGFIAQDVHAVWPQLVMQNPNGTLGLAYSRFVPLLLESIRELDARLKKVEARLNDLEKEA
jgi:hypothetical protein